MRTFETLLVLANGLTFLLLMLPQSHATRWVGYSSAVGALLAFAQVFIEGSRWQLFPAYLLAALFFTGWTLRTLVWRGTTGKALFHRFVAGSAFGLGAIALMVSIALPIILPVFVFPHPSGAYPIGTVTYHWTDSARAEVFGPAPRKARELMVQIWYPAMPQAPAQRAHYVDDSDALALAQARLHDLPAFTFEHLKYVTTNAETSVPVSAERPGYPVLIFLEGITGYRQMNMFMVEELVSQGYIVVAIDQPYVAASIVFPGGRTVAGLSKTQMNPLIQQSISPSAQAPILNGRAFASGIIPYLARDVSFAMDRLTALDGSAGNILRGKLDMGRVGIFGISLGGIVVGEACRREPRLRACLVMDAPMPTTAMQSGLQQPGMWITRDAKTMQHEGWDEADIIQHQTTMRRAFERSSGESYFVSIAGMFHANLMDAPFYSPLASRIGITGPIDGRRAHTIINAYARAFFDRHLEGKPTPLLDRSAKPFSEVAFETREQSPR